MLHAYDALFVRHAQDLLIEDRRAQDAIEDLRAGRDPARDIRARSTARAARLSKTHCARFWRW